MQLSSRRMQDSSTYAAETTGGDPMFQFQAFCGGNSATERGRDFTIEFTSRFSVVPLAIWAGACSKRVQLDFDGPVP
jgi:hypothetical protein